MSGTLARIHACSLSGFFRFLRWFFLRLFSLSLRVFLTCAEWHAHCLDDSGEGLGQFFALCKLAPHFSGVFFGACFCLAISHIASSCVSQATQVSVALRHTMALACAGLLLLLFQGGLDTQASALHGFRAAACLRLLGQLVDRDREPSLNGHSVTMEGAGSAPQLAALSQGTA